MAKDMHIGFRIEEEIKKALVLEAQKRDIPLAQLIRAILKCYLEENHG